MAEQTSQAVQNAQSLQGFRMVPAFREIFERGRYDIAQFARDFCDVELHDGQKKWVSEKPWAAQRVLACGNRWGKTTVSSVKIRHHGLYQTRLAKYRHETHSYRACALSLTLDMARICWDKCYYDGLAHPLYSRFIVEKECKLTPFPQMVVGDGTRGPGAFRSEIWARTTARDASYLAGHTFDYVAWDECSREPKGNKIRQDVLLMRLPDRDGRLDCTSTGNGRNWYCNHYQETLEKHNKGSALEFAMTGSSLDNPYISRQAVERARERMSPALVRQNILGGFSQTGAVFPIDQVGACYEDINYSFPEPPRKDAEYIGAADFGRLRDETVVLIARTDCSPAKLVNVYVAGNESNWRDIFGSVAELHRDYYQCPMLGDATSMGGDVILDTLTDPEGQYRVRMKGHQVGGSKVRRDQLILRGQRAVQAREIVWPYVPRLQELVDQLQYFDADAKNAADDYVMAFCLLALQKDMASHTLAARVEAPFLFGGLTQSIGIEIGEPVVWV